MINTSLNYRFKIFKDSPLVVSFSDRSLDMSSRHPDSKNNRMGFLKTIDVDYSSMVSADQVHGVRVGFVSEVDKGKVISSTDSLVTNLRNIALAVFTADCLPVFIYDKKNNAIGLAHAGWRGTKDRVVVKTIELMRQRFGTQMQDLICAFGPSIGACCYEVGTEVARYFKKGLTLRNGNLYLDLAGINARQLCDLGLAKEQIENVRICTACLINEFFSYRREKDNSGRMMSVMMLK
ncbi:MAG TPA: peptidoglycan editing factor PgeF [Candidatus Omnitrophica bacterium]|nr:peptidoglycan editing factor PgeF [Candidatus Omnitrophota bacterium]